MAAIFQRNNLIKTINIIVKKHSPTGVRASLELNELDIYLLVKYLT